MDTLDRLEKIGFLHAGEWKRSGSGENLVFELRAGIADGKNALYAFVIERSVMYLGKTTIGLRGRLQRYKTPAKDAKSGGTTNIKNNEFIRQHLSTGMAVRICVFHDNGLLRHGEFHMNSAAGLEDSLVKELRPPWNGAQKTRRAGRREIRLHANTPRVLEPEEGKAVKEKAPNSAEFRLALDALFSSPGLESVGYVDVRAGDLHQRVGGYPPGKNDRGRHHAMPTCSDVMRAAMGEGDVVLYSPPQGRGARLEIRYKLPRPLSQG